MKIKARIKTIYSEGSEKARADIILDDVFVIHGVKLIDGGKGPFILLPGEDRKNHEGNRKRYEYAHPLNAETRKAFLEAVLDAYEQTNGENLSGPAI